MTRTKVKISFIHNDADRRCCFYKRKRGLFKKAHELSVLCDVDVCVIIYSPYDQNPEVWPPSKEQVNKVIARFMQLPDNEQTRNMLNQEEFVRQAMRKANEQMKKTQRGNRQKHIGRIVSQCLAGQRIQNLNLVDLHDMGLFLTYKINDISDKMEEMRKQDPPSKHPCILPTQGKGKGKAIEVAAPAPREMPAVTDQIENPIWASNEQTGFGDSGWDSDFWLSSLINNDGGAGPSLLNFP